VGLVLQRALLLLTLLAATVAALWTQAEPILLALGQDPDIAAGTAQFLLRWGPGVAPGWPFYVPHGMPSIEFFGRSPCLLVSCCYMPADRCQQRCASAMPRRRATPALWFTGVFEALKRYLMAQASAHRRLLPITWFAACPGPFRSPCGPTILALSSPPRGPPPWPRNAVACAQEAVRPATVVTVISLCMAPLYNWLLIYKAGLGLYGAAYAMDAMQVGSRPAAAERAVAAGAGAGWAAWHPAAAHARRQHMCLRLQHVCLRIQMLPCLLPSALQATLAILLGAYCVARDRLLAGSPQATWSGLSAKAWSGWWQYCRFALPSVAMLGCEWSTFEVRGAARVVVGAVLCKKIQRIS
jgi:hypothetical protein